MADSTFSISDLNNRELINIEKIELTSVLGRKITVIQATEHDTRIEGFTRETYWNLRVHIDDSEEIYLIQTSSAAISVAMTLAKTQNKFPIAFVTALSGRKYVINPPDDTTKSRKSG